MNYYQKHWYEEALYSLALTDYISEMNDIPLAKEYDFLRNKKLKKKLYSRDTNLISKLNKNNKVKNIATKKAIPTFLKYNIVETSIENVC